MCNKQPRFNGSLTRCTIIPVLRKKTRLRPLCNHETVIYILVVLKWFLGICVIKPISGKCMFWLWHISRHCCISTNQLVCTHYVNSHNWNHIRIEICKTFNQIASTYFVNLQNHIISKVIWKMKMRIIRSNWIHTFHRILLPQTCRGWLPVSLFLLFWGSPHPVVAFIIQHIGIMMDRLRQQICFHPVRRLKYHGIMWIIA